MEKRSELESVDDIPGTVEVHTGQVVGVKL